VDTDGAVDDDVDDDGDDDDDVAVLSRGRCLDGDCCCCCCCVSSEKMCDRNQSYTVKDTDKEIGPLMMFKVKPLPRPRIPSSLTNCFSISVIDKYLFVEDGMFTADADEVGVVAAAVVALVVAIVVAAAVDALVVEEEGNVPVVPAYSCVVLASTC
jgi:hypothetical protein